MNQDSAKIHDALNYAIDILQLQIEELNLTGVDLDDIVDTQTGGIYINPFREEQVDQTLQSVKIKVNNAQGVNMQTRGR